MTDQNSTAFDADPSATGLPWTSRWRARYRHGDWPVLCGPTSLVVLQPAAPHYSELIAVLWEEVLASTTLPEMASRLAAFQLDRMPDFAALFWSAEGMRSLVRGAVRLIDPDSGTEIASGEGIQTWSEIGLGDRHRVEVVCGDAPAGEQLELPLVVGAATVSRIVLDRREAAQVSSSQGMPGAAETAAEPTVALPAGAAAAASAGGRPGDASVVDPPVVDPPGEVASGEVLSGEQRRRRLENAETVVDQPPVPPAGAQPAPDAGSTPSGETATLFASSLPGLPVPEAQSRPVAGVLHPSSGGRVVVDRPVVIGRAPSASRVRGDQLPRLLTVPSPSHDISRTHVQVAPDDGRLTVTDLNSTNGTILVDPGGRRSELAAGETVPLEHGSVIDLGDGLTIAVERE